MIKIVAAMLEEKEALDLIMSEHPADTLGADSYAFHKVMGFSDSLDLNEAKGTHLDAKAQLLVGYAQKYGGAYDLAVKVCSTYLQNDWPIPEALRYFSASVMNGDVERPKTRIFSSAKDQLWMRNEVFVRYMRFLIEKCEYKAQSNPASGTTSAADVLAAAFNENGYHMVTSDMVLNVWKNKKLRSEMDALM
ncbi:hypothetical protein [Mameliella sp.]|uniref:hypothetical protein n=1 Tax=Mameliella sp. TaxID=1924940 RepID=UPI003BAA39C2